MSTALSHIAISPGLRPFSCPTVSEAQLYATRLLGPKKVQVISVVLILGIDIVYIDAQA